jgi:hypothetical protein
MHGVVKVVLSVALVTTSPGVMASAQGRVVKLPPFHSVEVPDGGHVVIRYGGAQRVTLVRGNLDYTKMRVTSDGVLVIGNCRHECRGYRSDVEIEMPSITRLLMSDGGWIRISGSFPRHGEIEVEVDNGGTIDARSMVVDKVTASVDQGGRILTVPGTWLLARVSHGGAIIYWGNPQVRRSIEDGGAIQKGDAEELNAAFEEGR